jgi:hypothetical protein
MMPKFQAHHFGLKPIADDAGTLLSIFCQYLDRQQFVTSSDSIPSASRIILATLLAKIDRLF